jgi:2',3'-cyclic-nucleotide 2'-phosphodiesterase (5'-nucleotidase family)
VQAGALGSCVARIKIKVDDRTDKVLRIESGIFYPDQLKTDPAVKLLCQQWSEMEKLKGKTPVTATEKLYRLPVKKDNFSRLGELGAGALLKTTGADAALFSLREVKKQMFQYKNSQGKFIVNERILFGLFPFTNRICLIEVEKEDLTELEMSIREYTRKQKRRYFCAGALMMDKKGRLESSKPKFTLAVTDYVLTSFPVLWRKLQERGKWSVIPGSFERDIMRNALKSCR